jgi:hypothetical protein
MTLHKSLLNSLLIFAITGFNFSCNLINPSEKAPAYVEVEPFVFDPVPALQEMGPSTSTKIKDVWVYVDNKFLGTFELPARFPVLKTGFTKLDLLPGIQLNGIASTRSPYPFYQGSSHDLDLPENGTVQINPVTNYFSQAECAYCESFEGTGFSLTPTPQSDTIMYQLPANDPEVFEGAGSGVVYLEGENTKFEITSTSDYDLPGAGAPVFLELDYKINQEMKVGLFINIPGVPAEQVSIITLRPTEVWNKIYVQLGYTVSAYANASGYKIYFGAIKDPSVSKSVFYLDNIKVISF